MASLMNPYVISGISWSLYWCFQHLELSSLRNPSMLKLIEWLGR